MLLTPFIRQLVFPTFLGVRAVVGISAVVGFPVVNASVVVNVHAFVNISSGNISNGNDIEAKQNEALIIRHFFYRSKTDKLILKL